MSSLVVWSRLRSTRRDLTIKNNSPVRRPERSRGVLVSEGDAYLNFLSILPIQFQLTLRGEAIHWDFHGGASRRFVVCRPQ